MNTEISLQDRYAAQSICYGCGPNNPLGLQVKSFPEGDGLVCVIQPDSKYQAFSGFLYGGLIGCLLDCHCNWAAAMHLMAKNELNVPPCTVTAQYTVKFLRPTPVAVPLRLVAKVISSTDKKAEVYGELFAGQDLCATCDAVFVAVKPGHPAYHRW